MWWMNPTYCIVISLVRISQILFSNYLSLQKLCLIYSQVFCKYDVLNIIPAIFFYGIAHPDVAVIALAISPTSILLLTSYSDIAFSIWEQVLIYYKTHFYRLSVNAL